MGQKAGLSMLAGALTAWALLGPIVQANGWAKGKITSWQDGPQGWLLWVAIGLMLAEALSSFALVLAQQFLQTFRRRVAAKKLKETRQSDRASFTGGSDSADERVGRGGNVDQFEVAPASELVPTKVWASGLFGSTVLCVAIVSPMFEIPVWEVTLSVLISFLIGVLAVRALGQTDLNPVSAVGKLSQIVFALVAPGHVTTNIIAGAIAEAGAMQAGDLMQDLKTGHLLGASPRVQFISQLIGSSFSVLVSVAAYKLYETMYGVPSEQFPAVSAHVWHGMATLMNKGLSALPATSVLFAKCFGIAGLLLPILEQVTHGLLHSLLPSGVAFGVAMTLTPDWTIPRVVGAVAEWAWLRRRPDYHRRHMLMAASGFVLGEGVMSIIALFLKALRTPTL